MTHLHSMPFGAEPTAAGWRFRLWAPGLREVKLCLEGPIHHQEISLTTARDGWATCVIEDVAAGASYRWRLPDGLVIPDPASRFQPGDVHGPSVLVDPTTFPWSDENWASRPWEETILYELHVGTFTPAGTFRAVIDSLDHLVELGISAVELMPVNDFPGDRDWGYDGVALFAPDSRYGTPDDLRALVDACHARGLMVFLDVVYNHFGPEGNYLYPIVKEQFFDESRQTPWGAAIAFDGSGGNIVSDFFIHNALYWIEEFHFDGLRLDAVHAIADSRERDILARIAEAVHARASEDDRRIHLVLENDGNEARRLARIEGVPVHYVAQWNDDAHHVFHSLITGESAGYYSDYTDDLVGRLATILAEGFAYQGEPSAHRNGQARGEPSSHLPAVSFVNFLQNHDQVGNRAFGERIDMLAEPAAVRAAHSVLLLMPAIPMLWQGEEWGSKTPFLFFCDFGEDLHESVRDGRRAEFASFPEFQDPDVRANIPDPMDPDTHRQSLLNWVELDRKEHADRLAYTQALLRVRHAEIIPRLPHLMPGGAHATVVAGRAVLAKWSFIDGGRLVLLANLGASSVRISSIPSGRELWIANIGEAAEGRLDPWAVIWTLEDRP